MEFLHYYRELGAIFNELDTNGDHRITFAEFKKGFDLIGDDSSDQNFLRQEFNKIDTNQGGFILFDEVKHISFEFFIDFLFLSSSACIWPAEKYIKFAWKTQTE